MTDDTLSIGNDKKGVSGDWSIPVAILHAVQSDEIMNFHCEKVNIIGQQN